jgi:heme-degrading monooxygenase HmoA
MLVAMSRFEIKDPDRIDSVREAFRNRPRLVEGAEGFVRLDVLQPLDTPSEFWVMTYWTDRSAFESWYGTHAFKEAHESLPEGIKLIQGATRISFFDHIVS